MGFIWLSFFSVFFIKRLPGFARAVLFGSLFLTLILSTNFISSHLVMGLQSQSVVTDFNSAAQAIVILGGGVYRDAPEYAGDNLAGATLERIKYGAYLFDKTGIPILVSGGDPYNTGVTEASVMKKVLETEFLTPVRWVEDRSRDTFENAKYTARILAKQDISKIYLVTNASHMPRSTTSFQNYGLAVIEAPTILLRTAPLSFYNLLPNADAFTQSAGAFREWLGCFWYFLLFKTKAVL